MIVVLNGPLGIGKSTLATALAESIPHCVMLDGDHLIAANPRYADEIEHLHATLALLISHHRNFGYRHFVIAHIWSSREALADLRRRVASLDLDFRCFLLTLPLEENLRRIQRRAETRALDEREFEQRMVRQEREALAVNPNAELGVPLDVSAPVSALVATVRGHLGLSA